MICDSLLHDERIERLLEKAEQQKARITILSENFDPGKQLRALGGVAALLRFRVE